MKYILLIISTYTYSQTFYVRENASGSNNGSDWTNAYSDLPAVLTRGATYYVADGSYSGYNFDDEANGVQFIVIKKAIESDHGTNIGWQNDYGNSVAIFNSSLIFYTGYYIFDGQVGGGPNNWGSGHGFEVVANWDEAITSGVIVQFYDENASNIQIKHTFLRSKVPFQGYGAAFHGRDNSNILISNCYIPELFGVHLVTRNVNHYTIEYSYFFRNDNTSEWHSEFNSDIGSDYMTFRYNKFEEIDGTAVFAGVNGTGDPHDYWDIYGNLCINSVAFIQYYYQEGDDENLARFWKIYNNTIVGPRGGNINFQYAIDIDLVSNIWYNFYPTEYIDAKNDTISTDGKFRFYYTDSSTHNSLYNVYYSFQLSNFHFGQDYESSDLLNNEKLAGDPFRNSINKDYYLSEPISPGKVLNAPYNVDMHGNLRGLDGVWDRGALEYDTSITTFSIEDTTYISDTICSSDSVFLQNQFRKSSGTYYDVFKNSDGNDSVVITNLFVKDCLKSYCPEKYKPIWKKAGYPGEIPDIQTNIINVVTEGAKANGVTDDYPLIQGLIDNAMAPAVIYFPAGTYHLKSQLNLKSGIVLRGDGYLATHLEFDNQNGCVQAKGTTSGNYIEINGGLNIGSNKIIVNNPSIFTKGEGGHIRQGNVIETTFTSWVDPRSPGQMVKIIDIINDTLIIEPALNFDYANNPPLNPDYLLGIAPVKFIEQIGIEDLHIKRIHSDIEAAGSNINFARVADSWIRRVESEYTLKYHFAITTSLNIEIKDNYIHHARNRGDGGQGYGVSLASQSTSILVENNIFYECRHSMILQIGVNGCVFGYNYAERNFSDDGWDKPAISLHGHYVHSNLFEGNAVGWIGIGDYWGPDGPDNTFFRNWAIGTDRHEAFGNNRGIMYSDVHGPQYIIGNEITGQGVYYSERENGKTDTSLIFIHGNNVNGNITWKPGYSTILPESFYLDSKPAFFGDLSWPPFGGNNQIEENTIPAINRKKSQNYIPLKHYLTNKTISFCEGDSVKIGKYVHKTSTTVKDTVTLTDGIDSIIIYTIQMNKAYLNKINLSICEGDSIYVNGKYKKITGIYREILETINGCDSIIELHLTVFPKYKIVNEIKLKEGESYFAQGADQTEAGIYLDKYTSVNGCDSLIFTKITRPEIVAISEKNSNEKLIIYPNPCSNKCTIELKKINEEVNIEIYSRIGQKIYTSSFLSINELNFIQNIDVSGFQPGIYYIKIIVGNAIYNKILLIKNQ